MRAKSNRFAPGTRLAIRSHRSHGSCCEGGFASAQEVHYRELDHDAKDEGHACAHPNVDCLDIWHLEVVKSIQLNNADTLAKQRNETGTKLHIYQYKYQTEKGNRLNVYDDERKKIYHAWICVSRNNQRRTHYHSHFEMSWSPPQPYIEHWKHTHTETNSRNVSAKRLRNTNK